MKTFPLTVSSLEGDTFSGEVTCISLRGIEGELAVMAGHTPFITSVKPCDVTILTDTETKKGHTNGGLLSVSNNSVTLMSGSFNWI